MKIISSILTYMLFFSLNKSLRLTKFFVDPHHAMLSNLRLFSDKNDFKKHETAESLTKTLKKNKDSNILGKLVTREIRKKSEKDSVDYSKIDENYINDISEEIKAANKKKRINLKPENEIDDPNFVKVQLGSDENIQRIDMENRIKEAEGWVSKQLSDDEANILNRVMGIEAELGLEESDSKSKIKKGKGKGKINAKELFSDPFGKETARIKGFLEINPYICSGCGTPFQSKEPGNPGFLQKEKLQDHRKNALLIRQKQDAIKILDMAGIDLDSSAAEEVLSEAGISKDIITSVQKFGKKIRNVEVDKFKDKRKDKSVEDPLDGLDISLDELFKVESNDKNPISIVDAIEKKIKDAAANALDDSKAGMITSKEEEEEEDNIDLEMGAKRVYANDDGDILPYNKKDFQEDSVCICQRCFRLQQYGQVESSLRPGWSSHELLTPEHFESLLSVIKDSPAVVLCIVDLFDLQGSLLHNLKQIAGKNPIVIAANKLDLLPSDVSTSRIGAWIHGQVKEYCGLISPKDFEEERREEIATYGWAKKKVDEEGVLRRSNVHLVSCENGFGMDKLITSITQMANENGNKIYVMGAANVGKSSFINRLLENNYQLKSNKKNQPKKVKDVPQATVSNLPGTTLDFIKIKLPNGVTMIDTPGLINRGQLTSKLTPAELREVIPTKPINAITFRVSEGKCIMIGALANIELVEGRPFFFTFFISNNIKLHPTNSSRVTEFTEKHIGSLIFPPASLERLNEIGPFESKEFIVEGDSWKKSMQDIVIAGLGWVAITGTGKCKVKVTVPVGTAVELRNSLMPFEATHTTATFTGGRIEKKSRRAGGKNYGWRA